MNIRKAFTLMEILVVVSVLAILVGIIVPRIKGFQEQANLQKAKAGLKALEAAIESYHTNNQNTYPSALTDLPNATPQMVDVGALVDPLANPSANYTYSTAGGYYSLSSAGSDGVTGTGDVLSDGNVPTGGDDIARTNGATTALDVQTDENNCGTLGTACANGWTCTAGVCVAPDPCETDDAVAGTVCADGTVYVNSALRTTPGDIGTYGWLNCAPYGGSVGNGCYDAGYNLLAPNVSTWARNAASGEANIVILKALDAHLSDYPAAQACENSTANGHDDWYWPAMSELSALYTNRVAIGGFTVSGTPFSARYYWSSTEGSNMVAIVIPFDAGTVSGGNKADIYTVRCVRRTN